MVGTTHPKIAMAARRPLPRALLRQELARIREALDAGDVDQALHLAREVVQLTTPTAAGDPSTPRRRAGAIGGPVAGRIRRDRRIAERRVARRPAPAKHPSNAPSASVAPPSPATPASR